MVSPDPGGGGREGGREGGERKKEGRSEGKKEGRSEEEGKVPSFPGPAQLSVTCSTEKRAGRAWCFLFLV